MPSSSSFATFLDVSQAARKTTEPTSSAGDDSTRAASVLASIVKGKTSYADLLEAAGMPPSDLVETIGYLSKAGLVSIKSTEGSFEVLLTDQTRNALQA